MADVRIVDSDVEASRERAPRASGSAASAAMAEADARHGEETAGED